MCRENRREREKKYIKGGITNSQTGEIRCGHREREKAMQQRLLVKKERKKSLFFSRVYLGEYTPKSSIERQDL